MKEITMKELLEMFDPSVQPRIIGVVARSQATHVVVAENQQMDSSQFGLRTAMVVGPTCTYKTPEECEGKWLHDLPSQRQYFVAFAKVDQ